VAAALQDMGYSLQANRKTREGDSHPDRNAQFVHINDSVTAALAAGEPVISVDTKKKELVGDFKNAGREWRPQGDPQDVRVHDFLIEELGRAVPYGIYDLAADAGWVSVGINHDTSAFAVQTIRRWWDEIGSARYPEATRLVITAPFDRLRRRRRQWLARASVEARTATSCRRTGDRHRRASSPAGHQQMEQDRTPIVFIHLLELAG